MLEEDLWWQVNALLSEFRAELSPGHPPCGLKLEPLGHSGAAGDALSGMQDGRVVQVRLTRGGCAEQALLPDHDIYPDSADWIQEVMMPTNEEYRS